MSWGRGRQNGPRYNNNNNKKENKPKNNNNNSKKEEKIDYTFPNDPNIIFDEDETQVNLWTIGYGGLVPDDFVSNLLECEIELLVDIRIRPFSQYNDDYNSNNLKQLLNSKNIEYEHYLELGNVFKDTDFSEYDNLNPYHELLKQGGEILTRRLRNMAQTKKTCILCACKQVTFCHRNAVSGYLRCHFNYRINHI